MRAAWVTTVGVLVVTTLGIQGEKVTFRAEEAAQKGFQKLRLLKEDIGALLQELRPLEDKVPEANHSHVEEPDIDVYNFLKEVAKQHDIKITRKFLVYLSDLPLKGDINLHLAKLAVLVRKLSGFGNLEKVGVTGHDEEALLRAARQATSVESLDTSVERLLADKRRRPQKDTRKDLGEVPSLVLSFLDLLESKPSEMTNVILSIVFSKTQMSKETSQILTMGLKMFPKTRYFQLFVDLARAAIIGVAENPLGHKMLELVPALAETKDIQELLSLVKSEMHVDMQHISKLMVQPQVRDVILEKSARALSASVILFQTFIVDKTKTMVLNTFLASQGLPSIHPKKFIASGLRFLEKLLRSFTRWELDFKFGEELIIDHLKRFEKRGVTWDSFGSIEKEARMRLMSDFIAETFGETLGSLMEAQFVVFNQTPGPECAEFFLCQICAKANQTESYSGLQKYAAKGMSLVTAWSWGLDKHLNTLDLYNAVFEGTIKQNCDAKYGQNVSDNCKIFPWMQLEKEKRVHSEL